MFVHTCSACATRQLYTTSRITSLVNAEHGVEVHFTCWCGSEQAMLTGRRAPAAVKAAALAA